MDRVKKCVDCGYIAIRRLGHIELVSPPAEWREDDLKGDDKKEFSNRVPSCSRLAEKFDNLTWKESVFRNRECSRFTEWQPGFTPKEHLQMDFLERQEERHNRFLADQAERDRKWRRQDIRWRWLELFVVVVCASILTVVAQVAAAFIERNSLFPDRIHVPAASAPDSDAKPPAQPAESANRTN